MRSRYDKGYYPYGDIITKTDCYVMSAVGSGERGLL